MHPAIELLMKRMESNPDEFVKGHSRHPKWERIIEKYMEFVNPEDKKILKEKYSALQLDQMHRDIMAELLYGEENSREEFKNHEQLQMAFQEFRSQQLKELMK
jgi:hypothetical protein